MPVLTANRVRTFGYNADQWRNPRDGRWIDMPNVALLKALDEITAAGVTIPGVLNPLREANSGVQRAEKEHGPDTPEYAEAVAAAQEKVAQAQGATGGLFVKSVRKQTEDVLDAVSADLDAFTTSYVAGESTDIDAGDTDISAEEPTDIGANDTASTVDLPDPPTGHAPAPEEVKAAYEAIKAKGVERGKELSAARLDAAGYNEKPIVLSPEEFDAVQGAKVKHYEMTQIAPGKKGFAAVERETFYRGMKSAQVGSSGMTGRDLYESFATSEPDETFAGWGFYSEGTHLGNEDTGLQYAIGGEGRTGLTTERTGAVDREFKNYDGDTVQATHVLVRTKIHPKAQVCSLSDIAPGIIVMKKGKAYLSDSWTPNSLLAAAIRKGCDVIDLSETMDPFAGIAVLNRGVLIVEELL